MNEQDDKAAFERIVQEALKQDAEQFQQNIINEIIQERQKQKEFEGRLYGRWKTALDLFQSVFLLGQYRGDEFNRKIRPYAAARNDFTFEVLSRIHARSCVTMSAILTLLRTGHATDALARARTLHELYVTALFIREKSNGPQDGDALAERYLLYQDVEALKIAREYDKHYQKLAVAPLDPKTIPDLEAAVQTYKAKFSGQYDSKITKGSYGWATEKLGKLQPSFEDIENAVGVSHSRPYYKLSSYPVHAGPKGIFFDSGVSNTRNVLTAGPTNTGLADPAKMAINAFANCTNIMLGHTRYADEVELRVTYIQSVTTMHLMNTVSKTAIKAFAETQRELMQEEEEIQQQSGKKEHT